MDKNELNLKAEELKAAMHNRDFEKAVDIADALDLKKIKDNNFLSLVADAYELTHKYKEAEKVLLMAYENTNAGRHLAYRLCLIAVKNKNYNEAREFYEDFVELAPRDTARYILRYKMAKAQGDSIDKLIEILEEYVNIDMEEKWAYELAKLYHMAGDEEQCVDMCDEISLWFSEGKYVVKALELKKMHRPLTAAQIQKYEEGKKKNLDAVDIMQPEKIEKPLKPFQTEIRSDSNEGEIKIKPLDEEKFNTMDIQSVIADGMKEVEITDEENIHEGADATKKAPDFMTKPFKESSEMEEITTEFSREEEIAEIEKDPIVENVNEKKKTLELLEEDSIKKEELKVEHEELEETVEQQKDERIIETNPVTETEPVIESEPIKDIHGVEDILRKLQERGILKAETVQQAVNIIDEAGSNEEVKVNKDNVSTSERWEEDNEPVCKTKNNGGIKLNVVEPPKKEPADGEKEPKVTNTTEEVLQTETKPLEPIEELKKQETKPLEIIEEIAESEQDIKNTGKISTVPVFDLGFESPKRDVSNDIGQENVYENIVANSDLGSSTDKLPSREEIEEAIKDAEEAIAQEPLKTEPDNQDTLKKADAVTDLHANKNLSAKVEIISGADWQQPNTDEDISEKRNPDKTENPTEKADLNKKDETNPVFSNTEPVQNEKIQESKHESAEIEVKTKFSLTDEELAVFKNYLNVEEFERNIKSILQKLIDNYNPNGRSSEGNIIIMGNEKTGKTTLAIEMIKLVNRKRGRRGRRLAKVDAQALNRRGFRNSLNKLLGSDLVIENAQNLGAMTLSEIVDASGMFTDDMLIILEGETEGMEGILETSPRIKSVFNHVIKIKEYDIREWVEYGIRYAEKQGYRVDELGNLAFHKAVDDFFGLNNGIGQKDVENIVNQAIAKSGRLGRKLSGIFSSKKDEEGLIILVESDFNI